MKGLVPWVGGKSQLREQIIELFPKDIYRYVEVFGGAGWVLFGRDRHGKQEIINDLDGQLINLYRCVQHHPDALLKEIDLVGSVLPLTSREAFNDYKQQLEMPGLTDIQRAARYYYLIRASFGASRISFRCEPAALNDMKERMPEITTRLRRVVIENLDFEKVIKNYDRKNTLFYLDPPYYAAEGYYQGFGKGDHQRLQRCLQKLKGRFILSYNDTPKIRALYEGFIIREVRRGNSLSQARGNTGEYKELIITNYV